MKQYFQLLGKKAPIKGDIGIEIEAEGKGLQEIHNDYWRTERDGSLRGEYPNRSAEFVLNHPISLPEVVPALEMLIKALPKAVFDFSYRTSVHVHINVQELTHTQMLNMVYTYLLLEEPLMTYCGKSRKANRFCLRLCDAEGVLEIIRIMFQKGEGTHPLANDNVRYAAINLAALSKYGSLEFRGMRGNIEIPVIHTWTRALMSLREYAVKQKTPKDILNRMEAIGPRAFIKEVLGQELYELFNYPRILKDMARSYSISMDLPYAFATPAAKREPSPHCKWIGIGEQVPRDPQQGDEIVLNGALYEHRNGEWIRVAEGVVKKPVRFKIDGGGMGLGVIIPEEI
jgi:hypothetical protein